MLEETGAPSHWHAALNLLESESETEKQRERERMLLFVMHIIVSCHHGGNWNRYDKT